MKKSFLGLGAFLILLMVNPVFAQNITKKLKERKTERFQKQDKNFTSKYASTKVEGKVIATPDHWHNAKASSGRTGLDVPDFMKNIDSKGKTFKIRGKLKLKKINYEVKGSVNGFKLYKNGSSKIYAEFVPSEQEGYYIYQSPNRNGKAYFDIAGDLIVKYLNAKNGEIQELRFQSN